MAYTKTNWQDRQVTNPLRFTFTLVSGTAGQTGAVYDLVPNEGAIISAGTPLSATNLNKIETGIFDTDALVATRVDKSGDTMTGDLRFELGTSSNFTHYKKSGFRGWINQMGASGELIIAPADTVDSEDYNPSNGLKLWNFGRAEATEFVANSFMSAPSFTENGTTLTNKYLAKSGGTMTGALTLNNQLLISTTTSPAIRVDNSTNAKRLEFTSDSTTNLIRAGTTSNGAGALELTSFTGQPLTTLTLRATTVTATATLNAVTLQENGTALNSKYVRLDGTNNITSALITSVAEVGWCGTAGMSTDTRTTSIHGVGVNFRIRKNFVPSSVSLTPESTVGGTIATSNITVNGFWLAQNGNGTTNIYNYWRGTYNA